MKLVTFNVNGVRARQHQLEALVEKHTPDVIGLQETKVDDSQFPLSSIESLGYHVEYHGQPGHYGVALLTKEKPLSVTKGLPDDDADSQRRLIRTTIKSGTRAISVYNGYFPQGESRDHPTKFPNKRAFYQQLKDVLEATHSADESVVIMGDMNIAPEDRDIGIGEDNRKRWLRTGKTSFLPEEREWLKAITDLGYSDPFHDLADKGSSQYSWFDYRSRGFEREPKRGLRIDYFLVSSPLSKTVRSVQIDYEIRAMERPSDHCPVVLDINI